MSFVQGFIDSENSLNSFCRESQILITNQKSRLEDRLVSGRVNGRQLYDCENSNFQKEIENLDTCIEACKSVRELYKKIKPQLLEIRKASDSSNALPIEESQTLIKKITFIYNHLPRGVNKPYSCKRDQVQTIINNISKIIPRSLVLRSEISSLNDSISGHSLFASLPLSINSPMTPSLPFGSQSLSSSFCAPSRNNLFNNQWPHTALPAQNNLARTHAAPLLPSKSSLLSSHSISLSSSVEGIEVPISNNLLMSRSFPLEDLTRSENLPTTESLRGSRNFAEIISESPPENERGAVARPHPAPIKKKASLWKRLFNHTLTPLIGGGSLTLSSFVCLGFASSAAILVIPGLLGLAIGLPMFFLGVLWNLLPRPKVNIS